ncbi:MAG: MFS transporter [Lachnospiraceae bacterium]|nr:MFS transporter [Lachnospiraceae bacterium]
MRERYKKLILALVTGCHWFSLYAFSPYFTPYMEKLGSAASLIGFAVELYGASQMVLRIPLGITADKIGRQKIFVSLGLLLSALGTLIMRVFPTPGAMIAGKILTGASAATWVVFPLLFSGYFRPEESTKAIGIINAFNNGGKMLSNIMAGLLVTRFGAPSSFTLAFGAAALGLVLSFFVTDMDRSKKREPVKLVELAKVIKNPSLLYACLLAASMQFVVFATVFGFTANIASDLGATSLQLSYVTFAHSLASFGVSLIVGTVLVKYIGEKICMTASFAGFVIYCLLIPLAGNVWVIVLLQVIAGLATGILQTLNMAIAVRTVEPVKKSTAMGAYQAIYGIGMTVGPIVMGRLVELGGYRPSYFFMAGFSAAGAAVCYLLYRRMTAAREDA